MRAIGYSLNTALADLVDNCIVAGAKTIQIFSTPDTADLKVGILDDGVGMTEEELLEAMRLGTRSPLEARAQSDLGRFGLGLENGLIFPVPRAHSGDSSKRNDGGCSVELGPHCRVRHMASPDT